MDLSRRWLSEFVDLSDVDDKTFNDAMTLSGSKVETVRREGAEIQNVVAGRIVQMTRHENSDHMWVCQVDVGKDAPLQIVTGAQNQKEGDLVVVALDGAELPGGKVITAGKLRGVDSNGMCCSYQELGMTEHDWPHTAADGLFVLQTDPDVMAKNPSPATRSRRCSAATIPLSSLRSRPTAPTASPSSVSPARPARRSVVRSSCARPSSRAAAAASRSSWTSRSRTGSFARATPRAW